MIRVQQELLQALGDALAELAPEQQPPVPAFESPKQAGHGDLAITAAMQLAKPLKRNPRELAAQLVEALQRRPAVQRWVRALEIAGPGFINLRLSSAFLNQQINAMASDDRLGVPVASPADRRHRLFEP